MKAQNRFSITEVALASTNGKKSYTLSRYRLIIDTGPENPNDFSNSQPIL